MDIALKHLISNVKKYFFDKIFLKEAEIPPHGAPLCPPPRHRN